MPFNYPASEIFNAAGDRRVVWSQEEYEGALAQGWTETRPVVDQAPVPAPPAAPPEKPTKRERP